MVVCFFVIFKILRIGREKDGRFPLTKMMSDGTTLGLRLLKPGVDKIC
jgi:hypothetical protein